MVPVPSIESEAPSPHFGIVKKRNIDALEIKEGEFDYDISGLDFEEFPLQTNLSGEHKYLKNASLVVSDYLKTIPKSSILIKVEGTARK